MARRIIIIALILFAPLGVISAAIYEMKTGKSRPTLYLLLAAIPGAFLAALKELKESGLLPPSRLGFEVDTSKASISKWQQGLAGSDAVRQVTDVIIPLRIENTDPNKAIDILDVSIVPQEAGGQLQLPEMREIKVGSEKKWIYPFNSGAYSELFNDSKQKTIEPTKIKDFVIGVCEYGVTRDEYRILITFKDNWRRVYSKALIIKSG
jgi:hypothetical protein